MNYVTIIGAGASGMLAAVTAAESGAKVVLLERQARAGRKLLATGNGRCNLTNTLAAPGDYLGQQPGFVSAALRAFPPEAVMEFFSSLNLVCSEQYGGRVFPLSDSAGSVLDVLRFALESKGVELICSSPARLVSDRGGRFTVVTDSAVFESEKLIVACGGRAGGKLGGVPDGYELLRSLGHSCTKLYPALVPIDTESEYPRSLKGVRAEATVRLESGGAIIASGEGELQFTEKGISGPAAFDVSRAAAVNGGVIEADFLRLMDEKDIVSKLAFRRAANPELDSGSVFAGMLHSRLGMAVVKYSSVKPSMPAGDLGDAELCSLARSAKHFRLKVKGVGSFELAQVTAGGIRTSEFDPETLESRIVPGLFACGEVLDVDAPCGGFNLQWAWASGRLAGRLGKK